MLTRFDSPGPNPWTCPACGHVVERPAEPLTADGKLAWCALCGNAELYRRKDFYVLFVLNGLGMSPFLLGVTYALSGIGSVLGATSSGWIGRRF